MSSGVVSSEESSGAQYTHLAEAPAVKISVADKVIAMASGVFFFLGCLGFAIKDSNSALPVKVVGFAGFALFSCALIIRVCSAASRRIEADGQSG